MKKALTAAATADKGRGKRTRVLYRVKEELSI